MSTTATGTPLSTTLIVTPRERFGVAVRSLRSIVQDTEPPYRLIYIDGKSPKRTARQLQEICEENGFEYVRFDHFLSPNQARNAGLQRAETENVVFIDNDVIVSKGWLRALERCAVETGAEVVAPLTCQREPLHSEIHQAGGEITKDMAQFFRGPADTRRIRDSHLLQGKKVAKHPLERHEVQACEFHCVLAQRSLFERIGPLDERLLATKEHLDFSLSVWATGGKVVLEPASVVTYLFPAGPNRLELSDWAFFALRWSPAWLNSSLEHFRTKWDIRDDPYFESRARWVHWRHEEGIIRPTLKKIPVAQRSYRLRTWIKSFSKKRLERWSDAMARAHSKRYPPDDRISAPQIDASTRSYPVHSS